MLFVGSIGAVIEFDAGIDLSGADTMTIKLVRPDGTSVIHGLGSGSIAATGEENPALGSPSLTPPGELPTVAPPTATSTVRYLTQAGDLNVVGMYLIQVINTSSGNTIYSDAYEVWVEAPL